MGATQPPRHRAAEGLSSFVDFSVTSFDNESTLKELEWRPKFGNIIDNVPEWRAAVKAWQEV